MSRLPPRLQTSNPADAHRGKWEVSLLFVLPLILAVAGCPATPAPPARGLQAEPLPVQQAKAYPETITKRFVSLVDFEQAPGGPGGNMQVGDFTIEPADQFASRKFVYNITRTGAGAMEVELPARRELVYTSRWRDFDGYTLLSLAVFSHSLRDDLTVTLVSDGASWTSHRTLVTPGWNNVLIDIQRLAQVPGFNIRSVRSIRIAFADSVGPVGFNLDDIMLIDNRREIAPTPTGVKLTKVGLNYELRLPGIEGPVWLSQHADGLWRLADLGPVLQLHAPSETAGPEQAAEHLGVLGDRKVGQVTVLESNRLRLRIENIWYFPTRPGEWASLSVRKVRWEHTFYADGRCVTHFELNNSGGQEIASGKIIPPRQASVPGTNGLVSKVDLKEFIEVVRRSYMVDFSGGAQSPSHDGYAFPSTIEPVLCDEAVYAPADADRDRFDESQGCYVMAASGGNCRFRIKPGVVPPHNPVFRVLGQWDGPVNVNVEGLLVRDVARLADGSLLFMIPGFVKGPTFVEVSGKPILKPAR